MIRQVAVPCQPCLPPPSEASRDSNSVNDGIRAQAAARDPGGEESDPEEVLDFGQGGTKIPLFVIAGANQIKIEVASQEGVVERGGEGHLPGGRNRLTVIRREVSAEKVSRGVGTDPRSSKEKSAGWDQNGV
jgi:hypothetical protein